MQGNGRVFFIFKFQSFSETTGCLEKQLESPQKTILEELTFFGPWKHNSFCMSGRNNTRYRRDILPKHKSLKALLKPFVPWTDLTSWANAEKKGPEGLDVREEESIRALRFL